MKPVLVVEDSPTQAAEIAFVLEESGFQVTVAESGPDALPLLASTRFEALVLDVILPRMSGFELCQMVRTALAPSTPVLLLTTLNDPADILRGLECGANAYMNKPWEPERLVALLNRMIADAPWLGTSIDAEGIGGTRASRLAHQYLSSVIDHYTKRGDGRGLAQSHAALQRSEEMFALAAIGANDGLWDWDLDSDLFNTTPRWKELVDVPADSPSHPAQWLDRIHPADRERVEVELQAHLAGQLNQFENAHRVLRHDGRSRWVLVRGKSVRNSSGEAHRIAGSLTDISEYKAIEERLLRSTAEFNAFLRLFPDLFLHLDSEGTLLTRHGGAGSETALPLFTGVPIHEALPAAAARIWKREVQRVTASRQTAAFTFAVPVEDERWTYSVRLSPVPDNGLVAVVHRQACRRSRHARGDAHGGDLNCESMDGGPAALGKAGGAD